MTPPTTASRRCSPGAPLKLCPDFPRTVARFEAWWYGQVIDRPPVTLWLEPNRPYTGPVSAHRSLRERWLDVEFAVEVALANAQRGTYVGDTFPVFWPNVGPEITATLFGCELEFSENTSWSRPIVHRPEDWEKVLTAQPDFDNPYWRAIERMTDRAIRVGDGRFVVGMTDLHGNYDILSALRDPQALCEDLVDCPELVAAAGRRVAKVFADCFERSYAKVAAAGFGSTTWCPLYHAGPAYLPSCDFWCMVSPAIARDLILPDLITEMRPMDRSLFHLDGPAALKHLDLLLALPQLDAIQWVYGEGNGPASRWIDVYRRIRAAGKSVQVLAADGRDALNVLRRLGPEGLWFSIGGNRSADQAAALVKEIERGSVRR